MYATAGSGQSRRAPLGVEPPDVRSRGEVESGAGHGGEGGRRGSGGHPTSRGPFAGLDQFPRSVLTAGLVHTNLVAHLSALPNTPISPGRSRAHDHAQTFKTSSPRP